MAVKFTEEQQRVIDTRNKNILVSAAAGSGKTAVLTERILSMVCDTAHPVDIDRLLVVTFTNAAASEMRERIRAGLSERLRANPESEHIQRQSILIHNAQITTIDSFSLFILRNHFNEIGLDPAFRVADEGELKLLEQDTLSELLEDRFGTKEERFLNCVEFFCPGGKEKVLEELILNLSRYASSFPWPKEWLKERKKDYSAQNAEDVINSDYGRFLLHYVRGILQGCLKKQNRALKICEEPDGPYMYGEVLENERERLKDLIREFEEAAKEGQPHDLVKKLAARLSGFEFSRLPSKKDEAVSGVMREMVKNLRNEVKDAVKELYEKFFETPVELAAAQGSACAPCVEELIDLVSQFDSRMQEKKKERKIIGFSDMEHYCLDILLNKDPDTGEVKPSAVAKEYREFFEEVLIDEYQDSNLVQEYILKAVSGEEDGRCNRFMVGDVKQSIYKFRLARPELFIEKYENYKDDGDRIRIDLSKNFRSRSEVIDTVNGIFAAVMDKETGGIRYDDKAALYTGADYPVQEGCESELILIDKNQKTDAKEAEARCIAHKIKSLKASFLVKDRGEGGLREAKYSDFVILLRTNAGWDEEFKKVLEEEGIPAYITSKTGYFDASEVQNLLQFLRTLDNPRQDIPLFGTMKSVFGSFSDEELAEIRCIDRKSSLYGNLCRIAAGSEGNLASKCGEFLQKIEHYRDLTVYLPIRELLQQIVEDHHYLEYVAALPAGSKRKANVEMLFQKASDFENTSFFGLFHFVRYMEQLEKYDVDYGEADKLDENADVVRIMSIHKSKGLEFPVTFVAGLSKRFNMQDTNRSVVLDMDLGVGCDFVDPDKRIKNKTLRKTVIAAKMREDNLAEEMRVLYVALTRAKEKLIMTACTEKAEEMRENCERLATDKLSFGDFMSAGSYLDFLLPVIHRAHTLVTVENEEDSQRESFAEQAGLSGKRQRLAFAEEYCDAEKLQELKRRFAYRYPFEGMAKLYTKTTVSELKIAAMADKDEAAYHTFEQKEVVPYLPSFVRGEEKVSGTVRGNAFHRAMELLDFDALCGDFYQDLPERTGKTEADKKAGENKRTEERRLLEERLHTFLCRERDELRLCEEYFDALNETKIVNFLLSGIGFRMWRAQKEGKLYREQPFVLGISAERILCDIPQGEKVLIQGIIDVFFIEDDGIVLLDYKTDVINSMEDLKKRYETQLDYYGEALSKIMGLPVKEKLLYSFYLEKY